MSNHLHALTFTVYLAVTPEQVSYQNNPSSDKALSVDVIPIQCLEIQLMSFI